MSLHTLTIIVGSLLVAGGLAQIAITLRRARRVERMTERDVASHLYRPRLGILVLPANIAPAEPGNEGGLPPADPMRERPL